MKEKTKIIIPAAGFGTRVGSPLAKELIINPHTRKPLIARAIDEALRLDCEIHVITRIEKIPLVNYLKDIPQCTTQFISASREWADTVLLSEPHWNEHNILILPDTEWAPYNAVAKVQDMLLTSPIVSATFQVNDPSTWGIINSGEEQYTLCEKPALSVSDSAYQAWGILGFHKNVGRVLFQSILESTFNHQWITVPSNYTTFELNSFSDLTRSMKLL